MKYLGLYVRKNLSYMSTVSDRQKMTPITGENYLKLKSQIDPSRFCELYHAFEVDGYIFIFNSLSKFGKPTPYIKRDACAVFGRGDKVYIPRKIFMGKFEFHGGRGEKAEFVDRNCYTKEYFQAKFEPFMDVLNNATIINKIFESDLLGRRTQINEKLFQIIALIRNEKGIGRWIACTFNRRPNDVVVNRETQKYESTLRPGKITTKSSRLIFEMTDNIEDVFKPYTFKALEEQEVFEEELKENVEMINFRTPEGEKGIERFKLEFIDQHLMYVPEVFANDYKQRYVAKTLMGEEREPIEVNTSKTVDGNGK